MCDESMVKTMDAFQGERRKLVKMIGVGSALLSLPAVQIVMAANQDVVTNQVQVKTAEGVMDGYWIYPKSADTQAVPGVIMWPDILSSRPAFVAMAQRLAADGYAVLLVNPYYRQIKAPVVAEGETFRDPAVRERIFPYARALTVAGHAVDSEAFVSFVDAQKQTNTTAGIGILGYCMGGPIVFRAAANHPDRIAAVASFHGGGLATDAPDSPHLGLAKAKANFLVAVAENDHEKEPHVNHALEQAFADNNLRAEIEVYEGTQHGWCPLDSAVYHHEQAEKAWQRLNHLFAHSLKGKMA